ncbi:MAG: hypothetical protein Q8S73_27155 [Deltaproteobacteria bacterium]|nr:hypothetical protein [Deltaproteobacteria bacterium]
MSYLRLRLYSPTRSIGSKEGQLRICIASEGYFLDTLQIEEAKNTEFPSSATVIFDEALQATNAAIEYHRAWKDPTDGEVNSGSLDLHLPLTTTIDTYIKDNNFSERCLILVVKIESTVDGKLAIDHIGPDEDGTFIWDSNISSVLPASIHWLSQDQDTRPEHTLEAITSQAEGIEDPNSAMKALQIEIIEIRKALHRIQRLLVIIGIGMFFYAVAISI